MISKHFGKTLVFALMAAIAMSGSAYSGEGQGQTNGTGSVIDKPPTEKPEYGRSNAPDSTLQGGTNFSFPSGGGTTVPFPDPCSATPKPAYCEPPEDSGGGSGTPPPPTGSVSVGGEFVGCGTRAGSGSVSFSMSWGSDGVFNGGMSCPGTCYPGPHTARWLPAGGNAADYEVRLITPPQSSSPSMVSANWVNMGSGVNAAYKVTSSGLPTGRSFGGKVEIRRAATGVVVDSADVDLFLGVGTECP